MFGGLSGEAVFLVRAPLELFRLSVQRFAPPRGAAESEIADRAKRALRVGVELGDRSTIRAALGLERALFGSGGFGVEPLEPLFGVEVLESRAFLSRSVELPAERSLADLTERLVAEIEHGRIVVEVAAVSSLTERRDLSIPELPPLPPRPKESTTTFFEVRFVDEVGQAINGLGVEFEVDGEFRDVATNAAGVALLEDVKSPSAKVQVAEIAELEKILDPRWTKPRLGKPPKEANTTRLRFEGGRVGPLGVKAVLPNTVVIEPPRGNLLAQLFDKSGKVAHAEREYTIEGPESFSGKTDKEGILRHEHVFPGDYELKFTLEFFEGKDKKVDSFETSLLVQAVESSELEVRQLGAVPRCVQVNLHGFFNTNKAFLLPTALPGVRALRKLYLENSPAKLLVVGHADTKGGAEFNDPLSLERARATVAYLEDDVDAWLAFYDSGVPEKKRWGKTEDRLMLSSLPDFRAKPKGQDAVVWFQTTRRLTVDGKAGPQTRKQLVTEYLSLDGVSLEEFRPDVEATAHGCGENFPLDESGAELDEAPENEKRDPGDRRVEFFFFDAEFGILPEPPGDNSKAGSAEYPAWRKRAERVVDLEAGEPGGPKVTFVELVDNLFRTNSAVVLPEGEAPSDESEKHESLTSVGAFATLLRFNAENRGRRLLVAGHTDTTATVDFNQKLSEERASGALALLAGDRESFKNVCDARHTVADYKQILSWVSRAFTDVSFDCDPGKIDENAATGIEPVRRFQRAYNANKSAIGATAPDLDPDGAVGKLTWGAFFDCYEFALRQELGEDESGVQALREELVFADDEHPSLGFSEHFPIEELGVDNYKSQSNRRVELLMFPEAGVPDLAHAAADPETSEIYLPGEYERKPVESPKSAKRTLIRVRLLDAEDAPIAGVPFEVAHEAGSTEGVTTADGVVEAKVPAGSGKLTIITPDAELELELADLPPATTVEGAQHRLNNLDYDCGSTSGTLDQRTRDALRDFQTDHDLPTSGQVDPATSAMLVSVFGN